MYCHLEVARYSLPSQMHSYSLSFVPRNGRVPDRRICSRTPAKWEYYKDRLWEGYRADRQTFDRQTGSRQVSGKQA